MTARNLSKEQVEALAKIQDMMSTHGIHTHELQHLTKQERKALLFRIQALMIEWRIEPWELTGLGRRELSPASGDRDVKVRRMKPRYRHPVSGAVWSGQGKQPQWLKDALIAEGLTVAQLRV